MIFSLPAVPWTGDLLYEAGYVNFYLGAGGFGGDPGPKGERLDPPKGGLLISA